ncbi:hypothetical protein D9M71_522490 [compost metagenome]
MDADAPGAQLVGQVAAGSLQRGLHRTHQVVVGHHLVGAVVAHGEQSATVFHQRRRQAGHAHEGVAGDFHGLAEALRRGVEQAALQVFLRRPCDGVHQDVQLPPVPFDLGEHRLQLAGPGDVQRHEDRRVQLPGQRLDMGAGLVVGVGDGHLGAQFGECPGAAVGDRVFVGHADHQGLGALERRAGDFQSHVHFPRFSGGMPRRADVAVVTGKAI